MSDNQMSPQAILIGAVLGGLLGTAASSVLSTKNERSLTDNLGEYGEKIKSLVQDLHGNIANNISDGAECLTEKAQEIVKTIKNEAQSYTDFENKDFRKGVLVGAVLGGLLGAGGACVYNECHEKKTPGTNWKKIAQEVLEIMNTKGFSQCRERCTKSHTMDDMLDFAVSGLQLWKNMQRRK